MPEISVIIPVYNKRRYLSELWDMLLQQTFTDFECLLIDDGSTDGSGKICDEIATRDARFKVYHVDNGGVSRARNLGLDNATGKYITFIDADDGVHPEYLNNLYQIINKNSVDMVIGAIQKVWKDSEKTEIVCAPYTGVQNINDVFEDFSKVQLETGIFGFCVNKLLPKEKIGEVRFNETICLAEDLEFYLSIYPKIKNICFDKKSYYYYLQEAENSTVLKADEDIDYMSQLKIYLKYRDMLIGMNAFENENQTIVNTQLNKYMFFSIFHCQMPQFNTRFAEVVQIQRSEKILLLTSSLIGKAILLCIKYNACFVAKGTVAIYRLLRDVKRKVI